MKQEVFINEGFKKTFPSSWGSLVIWAILVLSEAGERSRPEALSPLGGGGGVCVSFSTITSRSPVAVLRAQCNPTVLFLGYTQAKDKAPEILPTTSHAYPVCFYPRELPKQNTAADLRSQDKSHGEEAFSSTTFLTTGLAFS